MSIHASRRSRRLLATTLFVTMTAAVPAAHARPLQSDSRLIRAESALGRAATPPAARPRAAGPAAGRVLGGFTGQGWPVVLEISNNTKRIALAATGLEMRCTSGVRFTAEDSWTHVAIGRNGGVQVIKKVSPMAGSSASITGGSRSLIGVLNRRQGTFFGRWRLHLEYLTSGGQADHCDSGAVPFAARL